jgi:putative hemolysin
MKCDLLVARLAAVCIAGVLAACTPTVTPVVGPVETKAAAGLPNPASVYCQEQGYTLEIRSDTAGGQFGICIFPDGSECDEWAFFRGECAPAESAPTTTPQPNAEVTAALPAAGETPVEGWLGSVTALPEGSQFDDYFQALGQEDGRYGIDSPDPLIAEQLSAWRNATSPTLRIWGTLHRDVPDAYGMQIVVTRLEVEGNP